MESTMCGTMACTSGRGRNANIVEP
jgi:hypothetical protein